MNLRCTSIKPPIIDVYMYLSDISEPDPSTQRHVMMGIVLRLWVVMRVLHLVELQVRTITTTTTKKVRYTCAHFFFFSSWSTSLKTRAALTQAHRATVWMVHGNESYALLGQMLSFCEQLSLAGCGKHWLLWENGLSWFIFSMVFLSVIPVKILLLFWLLCVGKVDLSFQQSW